MYKIEDCLQIEPEFKGTLISTKRERRRKKCNFWNLGCISAGQPGICQNFRDCYYYYYLEVAWEEIQLPSIHGTNRTLRRTSPKLGCVAVEILCVVPPVPQKFLPQVIYNHITAIPLLICTWFLKNQFGKIKLDKLDFYSISNWIFTVFVACKIQFWACFLQTIIPVCRTWFFQLDFSKFQYRSTGGMSPILDTNLWLLPYPSTTTSLLILNEFPKAFCFYTIRTLVWPHF